MVPTEVKREETLGWFRWWLTPLEIGRRGEECIDGIWLTVWRLVGAVPNMFLTDVRPGTEVVRDAAIGEEIIVWTFTGVLLFEWRDIWMLWQGAEAQK
jgi:hypothetical protein